MFQQKLDLSNSCTLARFPAAYNPMGLRACRRPPDRRPRLDRRCSQDRRRIAAAHGSPRPPKVAATCASGGSGAVLRPILGRVRVGDLSGLRGRFEDDLREHSKSGRLWVEQGSIWGRFEGRHVADVGPVGGWTWDRSGRQTPGHTHTPPWPPPRRPAPPPARPTRAATPWTPASRWGRRMPPRVARSAVAAAAPPVPAPALPRRLARPPRVRRGGSAAGRPQRGVDRAPTAGGHPSRPRAPLESAHPCEISRRDHRAEIKSLPRLRSAERLPLRRAT